MKQAKRAVRKKEKPMNLPNPLVVDEQEFTDAIDKMIHTKPEPLKNVVKRRSPERDPRYLPVFPAMVKKKEGRR